MASTRGRDGVWIARSWIANVLAVMVSQRVGRARRQRPPTANGATGTTLLCGSATIAWHITTGRPSRRSVVEHDPTGATVGAACQDDAGDVASVDCPQDDHVARCGETRGAGDCTLFTIRR